MHTGLFTTLATMTLAVGLGLVAGCAPLQAVAVRTEPPGAAIITVRGGERQSRGRAPVRFEVRGDQPFTIEARYPDHGLATVVIPGRELDAQLDLVLRPARGFRDRLAVLEQLLSRGPLDVSGIVGGNPSLDLTRVSLAVAGLLTTGEVRTVRIRESRRTQPPNLWGRMFPILDGVFATNRHTVIDLSMRGVRRLARSFSPETVQEQLLASRVDLHQRLDRAEALLDRSQDRER